MFSQNDIRELTLKGLPHLNPFRYWLIFHLELETALFPVELHAWR